MPPPTAPPGPLPGLPAQPAGTPWPDPDGTWPEGPPPAGVDLEPLLTQIFEGGALGTTYAVVVVHRGVLVAERYGGRLDSFTGPGEEVGPATALLGWSMAKSALHAALGIVAGEGRFDPAAPAPVPEWQGEDDPRRAVTGEHLLAMRDGLDFTEDYVDAGISDVIEMLFGEGKADMARFAADRPLAAAPGERFNYSSGSTNILSGMLAREVGPGDPYRAFLHDRLFGPIGAHSARPGFDEAGTWVASSFLHATARDFARFGLLYLRGGVWDGARVVPGAWVDTARRARSVDPDGLLYSAHWWVVDDGHGTFAATGYEGQSITLCPAADLVVVRLGKTPAERYPELRAWRAAMVAAFTGAP